MSPRAKLFDAMLAASLVAAAAVAHAAYTRKASRLPGIEAAPQRAPHVACAFPIAEECRKLDWWPE